MAFGSESGGFLSFFCLSSALQRFWALLLSLPPQAGKYVMCLLHIHPCCVTLSPKYHETIQNFQPVPSLLHCLKSSYVPWRKAALLWGFFVFQFLGQYLKPLEIIFPQVESLYLIATSSLEKKTTGNLSWPSSCLGILAHLFLLAFTAFWHLWKISPLDN